MAEIYGTRPVADRDPEEQAGLGGNLKAATNLMGAAVSLALLVGVGVWGYKLLMRDVSGIPVVRAIEGPMRVQPENPGGDDADHQGLAVNAVAAIGTAEAPPDRLVLAPRPVELAEEDQPVAQMIRPVARDDTATVAPAAAVPGDGPQPPLAVEEPEAMAAASPGPGIEPGPEPGAETDATQSAIDAIVAQLAGAVRPVASGTEVVMTASAPIVAPAPLVVEGPKVVAPGDGASDRAAAADPETPTPAVARDVPGVALSLRPQLRPAGLAAAAASAATVTRASAPAAQPVEVDPGAVPVGTRVVQLGAFDTPDMARTEWDRLNGRFGDYLQGKQRVVQEASSGGRTFWRLRAMGFDDLNDARRFCAVLVSEGADCIPVVTR